ncbi:EF-hand domain-containing protein [Halioxenophilus sp. WMMB6]|uniref:EF-hand domain-containing protein n=1 Tax=Halioxenophilus sp. WMMB6 TaxID=3073815 RepID=UPI00295EDC6F|nr:EF-hand domain-containing protein [Halioxenophilus sp. WMMB6]
MASGKRLSVVAIITLLAGSTETALAIGDGSRLFNAIDKNHNGVIEEQELTESRTALFHRLDSNTSGYLEQSELENKQQRLQNRWPNFPPLADLDGDGLISLAEFGRAPLPLMLADADGSGAISEQEFQLFVANRRQ